jgi:quinol monooxygenase YgiN
MKYVVTAQFKTKPGCFGQFMELIVAQAGASLAEEEGCLFFDVCRHTIDPDVVLVYEVYKDTDAYVAHRAQKRHPEFVKAAAALLEDFNGGIFRSRDVLDRLFGSDI